MPKILHDNMRLMVDIKKTMGVFADKVFKDGTIRFFVVKNDNGQYSSWKNPSGYDVVASTYEELAEKVRQKYPNAVEAVAWEKIIQS